MENPLFTFTTQPYPPRQRFEVWREEVNAIFDITISEPESSAFNYRLATGYLGSLLMGSGAWDGAGEPVPYRVKRSTQMIRRDSLDHYY
ncbi:AraC family transcriptional regulator, partial [Pseudomonas tolaasii]|nr:AraC family transcriptional regulator [Pseudomonas tolaasii]